MHLNFTSTLDTVNSGDCWSSDVVAGFPKSGLGANLLFISLAMTKAVRLGQPLVLIGDFLYGAHDGCSGGGLGCFFVRSFSCQNHSNPIPGRVSIPENFEVPITEFSELGVFWWRAWTLSYVVRPALHLESRVLAAKRAMGWPRREPVLAVHVRHGDWCTDVFDMNLHAGCLDLFCFWTHFC